MVDTDRRMPALSASRTERRALVGSPPARTSHAAIAVGATQTTDFEGTAFERYVPFNVLIFGNNSDEELTLTVQGQPPVRILARESRTFGGPGFALRMFQITNEDGVNATGAGEIRTEARYDPADADTAARLSIADRLRGLFRG